MFSLGEIEYTEIYLICGESGGCQIQEKVTALEELCGKCTRAQSAIRPETNPDLPVSESWELSQDG